AANTGPASTDTRGKPGEGAPLHTPPNLMRDFLRSLAKYPLPGPSTRTNQSSTNSILEDRNKSAKQHRPRFAPAGTGCAHDATSEGHFISRRAGSGPINVTKIPSLISHRTAFTRARCR